MTAFATPESQLPAPDSPLAGSGALVRAGTWEWDLTTDTIAWSDSMWSLTGFAPGSVTPTRDLWVSLMHPEDREDALRSSASALDSSGEFAHEYRLIRGDGSTIWVLTAARVLRDESGNPTRMAGTVLDVTLRHRTMAALAANEARYRSVTDALHQLIWRAAPDGQLLECNRHWYELTGLSEGETLDGSSWAKAVHPDDLPRLLTSWEQHQPLGEPWELEYRLRRATDGQYCWHFGRCTPIRNGSGEVVEWLGTAIDIQRVKEAAEAERRSEALYRAYIEQAGEPVWVAGPDGYCLEVNQAAADMLGYQRSELLGSRVRNLFHPEDEPGRARDLQRVQTGETVQTERRLRRKDGTYALVEGIARPLDEGRTLVFFRDVTQRRAAEEALRRRELEFRAIFELAAVGAAQADALTFRFTRVNQKLCELTGYSAAELLERTFLDITHPEDREPGMAALTPVLKGWKEEWVVEKRYVRKDGSIIWAQVHGALLRDASGQPYRTLAIIQDITTEREARQALEASEHALREAQRVAGLGSWRLNLATGHSWWSEEMFRIFHLNPTEAPPGLNATRELIHAEDWSGLENQINYCARFGGGYQGLEFRLLLPDGAVRWVVSQGAVEADAAGQPEWLLGTCQDITERKTAELERAASDARYRTLVDAVPQLVWTYSVDRHALELNEQFRNYLGTAEHQVLAAGWAAVIHAEELAQTEERWQQSVSTGTVFEKEYRLKRWDGEYRWHLSRALPVRDALGRVTHWCGTCTDIHDRQLADHALREEHQRKDEFLAMLAHELRNPLAPIANAAQVLKLRPDDLSLVNRQREIIERNAGHLSRLVDDLLEVARINEGKIALKRETVDLGVIVQQAVTSATPRIQERGHELSVSVPLGVVLVDADPVRVVQILVNLLTNASKYTDPGGRIQLVAATEGGEAVLRVSDNGRGIDPELLPHVFELFVQGPRTLARTEGGLGVGLTLARQLVKMHGGSLSAHSDGLGHGSEFTVRLPIHLPTAEAVALPIAAPPPASAPSASNRVLLVEDNIDAAETLAELLTLWGLDICAVHDGPMALKVAASFQPDLILLDIGLPGMDGYEVARRLRAEAPLRSGTPSGPVLVALTGYADLDHRARAEAAGFDHHLAKPLEPAELQRLLATLSPG